MRMGTRPEFLSDSGPTSALTQELAWLPPRKGLRRLKAFRRHRALRCAGYHYLHADESLKDPGRRRLEA